MDSAKALEMDYLLCDVLKITMDTLDTIPLHIVTKMREVVEYEEELLMHSTVFNKISILKQEIELLEVCREDKNNIEYEIVMKWLKNRVENLEED